MTTDESCTGCWWQEGGRCYVGEPPRNEQGQSLVMAGKRCDKFWNKRAALETVIPGDKLTILSERKQ